MEIVAAGLNHRTAPVGVRELASLNPDEAGRVVKALVASGPPCEALVLSTCNRTDIYAAAEDGAASGGMLVAAAAAVKPAFASLEGPSLYLLAGREAVLHLLRTASGLDSQVLGEDEIAGQVREAFEISRLAGGIGPVADRLRTAALAAAGRVRSETGLCRGAVSVSSAAVDLAKKVFRRFDDKVVLVIGAGRMARLACCCLRSAGAGRIMVANRTPSRAESLAAEFGAGVVPFESVPAAVRGCHLVISAVGGGPTVLRRGDVESAAAQGSALQLVIDISVPRSVDPGAAEVESVFLKTIDDLNAVVSMNLGLRAGEIPAAERIAAEEADRFDSWLQGRDVDAAIGRLAARLENIRKAEIARTLKAGGNLCEEDLERLTRSMMDKVLYNPASALRGMKSRGADFDRCMEMFREMFGLDGLPGKED